MSNIRETVIEVITREEDLEESQIVQDNHLEYMDSLDKMALECAIEREFDITFYNDEFNNLNTITELVDMIKIKQAADE